MNALHDSEVAPSVVESAPRRAYRALVSPRLAIGLLGGVLICCVVGVTAFSAAKAWEVIFGTFWFNGLLVLLAISSAAAFFSRIWGRKLTLVSAGMILFHLCFVTLLGGVVFNGLFHFHGVLRLTEGETLPNDRLESYDEAEMGRFFSLDRLRGATTLVRMHRDYRVEGLNKRAAYEIQVEDEARRSREIIYFTRHLDFHGVRYFPSKEGYAVLVVLSEEGGREIYGGYVPLQSLLQPDGSWLYATGTAQGPSPFAFPAPPEEAVAALQLLYRPNTVQDRAGEVTFEMWPLDGQTEGGRRSGAVPIGGSFNAGAFTLSGREVRYWVGMNVRYDPGLNVALGSLVVGFVGMALTFVGRVRQSASRRRAT